MSSGYQRLDDDAPRQVRIPPYAHAQWRDVRLLLVDRINKRHEPGAITESRVMAEMIAVASASLRAG